MAGLTDGDTTGAVDTDTSQSGGDGETDTSGNTLDGSHWVCDDCQCDNQAEESILECFHCHKPRSGELRMVHMLC